MSDFPDKQYIELTHYKQRYSWDCGVSCVIMVLPPKKRNDFLANFMAVCKEEGFNRSTWTIDLCYLLKRFEIKHSFFTITMGIHPSHSKQDFYRTAIKKDEERVKKRFQLWEQNGLCVNKSSVSLEKILGHLIYGPVIVLVNAKLLSCNFGKLNQISTKLLKCISWPDSFQGHYVVLCGFDLPNQRILYRNPTYNDHICMMTFDHFEEARKSYGTDEDIIFIDPH